MIWNAHVAEWTDLPPHDRSRIMQAVAKVETVLREHIKPTKVNLASLGNVVPHLHWHVIARFQGDAAWPAPVWGRQPAQAYTADELKATMALLRRALAGDDQLSLHWLS